MAAMTVEQRIIAEFDASVPDLLAKFANRGMTSKEVAEQLDCGVSNVRRIARKYNIRFNQPAPQSRIMHSDQFNDPQFNAVNFLSRSWNVEAINKVLAEVVDQSEITDVEVAASKLTEAVDQSEITDVEAAASELIEKPQQQIAKTNSQAVSGSIG